MEEIEVPPYFLCPISLQIMKDPVIIPTGITYDRESIEKWLFSDKKNKTCPVTKQVLPDNCDLTPNHTLRRLIQGWCTMNASHGVERIPTPKPPVDKTQIAKLIRNGAKSPEMQRVCLQKLRAISLESDANRRSMESAGVVEFLASLIVNQQESSSFTPTTPSILEEMIVFEDSFEATLRPTEEALSLLYNLHVSEAGLKNLISKNGRFVDSLIHVLQIGRDDSRAYAVFLLESIFQVADPVQVISLKPGFFTEIVQFLNDQISKQALKSSLQLLIHLCPLGRNRVKAVEAGAVPILIELLLESSEKRVSEMLLLLLDVMCSCAEERSELLKHGAGLAVVSKKILRVSQEANERAVRILLAIAKFSATPSVVQEMLQLGVVAKLCLVIQVETIGKMKERAREILNLHRRAWKNSPCMPDLLHSLYPS